MFIARPTSFTAAEKVILSNASALETSVMGLVAGTLVETSNGWKAVESLATGDQIYTYDGALRTLIGLERQFVEVRNAEMLPEGLVHIPGGVLSNSQDMLVPSTQKLLLESAVADRMFGRPAVLVAASELVGHEGIHMVKPNETTQIVRPIFADEEVIWANSGMLFHCASDTCDDFFETVDHLQARALVRGILPVTDCDQFNELAA